MKKLLIASSLLLVAALVDPATAQTQPQSLTESSPRLDLDDDGPLTEPRHIGFGMTAEDVMMAMKGKPDEKLAPDLWVYWHFRALTAGDRHPFDTLVVYFSEGRVVKYRLVERQPVLALLNDLRKQAKAAKAVAKK